MGIYGFLIVDSLDELGLIAVELTRHGVNFVVVGGWAAHNQNYDLGYLTQDIDITPELQLDNLRRLAGALNKLQAHVKLGGEARPHTHTAELLARVDFLTLVCDHGKFDLVFEPEATGGYDNLIGSSQIVVVHAHGRQYEIRCAGIEDIVRSKTAVNRPKDANTVAFLRFQIEQRQAQP